ncbi:Hsp20 family protein [Candidatus Phytoplasma phoenicium]|uniref:Hsp20-family chaperone n=1 Tax=Candidatus Phytoplasma phoenicium TaxID=198422 RepID=A0A0L0MJH1_9MOLU|nr:Hsp20 family protein [Candidatus Phytoplasma phoenicium]KND62493.1 Hsp20-family chaperone [Candidatus Phytoplasma phoenicium]
MTFTFFDDNQDLLEHFLKDWRNNSFSNNFQSLMKTDIKEYHDSYVLISEVPGFKKENIKISLDKGILVIEAQPSLTENKEIDDKQENNKEKMPKEKFHYLRQERLTGIIKRSFNLGEQFSIEDIKGNLENGLLTIKVNKKQKELQPKKYLELK